MNKRIAVVGGILLLMVVAGAVYFTTGGNERQGIFLSGNIEATTVDLSFQTMGRLSEISTDEGQVVTRGQAVAVLDKAELRDREANARARLAGAESQLPQLETSMRLQRDSTRTEIERAQANLETARAQWAELRNGPRLQEVEQLRQAQAAAESRRDNARLELTRARELYSVGSVPKKVLDSAQLAGDVAEADRKRAAEALSLIKEGVRSETLAAAEGRVRQAEAQLQQARLGELMVRKIEQQMQTAQTEVEYARSQLKLAQTQLGYAELVSPIAGRVIAKNRQVGEVVAMGAPILSIADLDDIWLRVYIDEADLGKIKLGQPVTVTTDSYPGKQYPGTIAFISSAAEFTPKTIQTQKERVKLVYRLKIQIKNVGQELKPGMPADASLAP